MQRSLSKAKQNLSGIYRLARDLPEFFSGRITPEQAREGIRRALDRREANFLQMARTRIYDSPRSPYLALLKIAGCEFSDLAAEVRRLGLEKALGRLAGEGVYLTPDEFKGKKDVARGGRSLRLSRGELARADRGPGIPSQSSGSTGRPLPSFLFLDLIADWSLGHSVFFAAHDLFTRAHAVYDAMLPSSGSIINLLMNARVGVTTERWFARQVPPAGFPANWYNRLVNRLIVWRGKQSCPGFPAPDPVAIEEMGRIVLWIRDQRRRGAPCCVRTTASNAARIAQQAGEMGVSLEGGKFIVSGEPFTESKREALERAGAGAILFYGAAPGMYIGFGCASPAATDEVHVNEYMLALAAGPEPVKTGPPPAPLLFTTLNPTAPVLLLNVDIGDNGTLTRRDCGCGLERAGLSLHLHHIRSHDKFTSEGMNYFYGDLYELLEKVLPAEFGGGPGDYQIVEEEDESGQTRLTLRVDPRVGALDQRKLLARFRRELAAGSRANAFQSGVWQNAGTLRVRREAPVASARGKILPLQMQKKTG